MAKLKKGKFLAIHTTKIDGNTGKPLRSTFPIKNKAYHLENGWKEVDKYDDDEDGEVVAPEVAPPAKEPKAKAEPKPKADKAKAEPKAPGTEEVTDAV